MVTYVGAINYMSRHVIVIDQLTLTLMVKEPGEIMRAALVCSNYD